LPQRSKRLGIDPERILRGQTCESDMKRMSDNQALSILPALAGRLRSIIRRVTLGAKGSFPNKKTGQGAT
jgi:hypothetical protein